MKKILSIFLTVILLCTINCIAAIAEEPIPAAYMWQESELTELPFELVQDETNSTQFTAIVHPYTYKDNVRIAVYKVVDLMPDDEDITGWWETVMTSSLMRPDMENVVPIELDPIEGLYKIQFESVSVTPDGDVDEEKLIYILCKVEIDANTMEILSMESWHIDTDNEVSEDLDLDI